jgi:hypothetical protein
MSRRHRKGHGRTGTLVEEKEEEEEELVGVERAMETMMAVATPTRFRVGALAEMGWNVATAIQEGRQVDQVCTLLLRGKETAAEARIVVRTNTGSEWRREKKRMT